jgi:hypothetical protein
MGRVNKPYINLYNTPRVQILNGELASKAKNEQVHKKALLLQYKGGS